MNTIHHRRREVIMTEKNEVDSDESFEPRDLGVCRCGGRLTLEWPLVTCRKGAALVLARLIGRSKTEEGPPWSWTLAFCRGVAEASVAEIDGVAAHSCLNMSEPPLVASFHPNSSTAKTRANARKYGGDMMRLCLARYDGPRMLVNHDPSFVGRKVW